MRYFEVVTDKDGNLLVLGANGKRLGKCEERATLKMMGDKTTKA